MFNNLKILDNKNKKKTSYFYKLKKKYGLSSVLCSNILNKFSLKNSLLTNELSANQLKEIEQYIQNNYLCERNLILYNRNLHRSKISIKKISSLRDLSGLPVRGQRTHSNGRTQKRKRNRIK